MPKSEMDVYETALKDAADAAYDWVYRPMDRIMNEYNIKVKD